MRVTTTVTIMPIKGIWCLHFCQGHMQGENLQIPLSMIRKGDNLSQVLTKSGGVSAELFQFIEDIVVCNGAHNLTSVKLLRECGQSVDLSITYNVEVPKC